MGPNTTSVFMDILARDPSLPQFDGTISKALIQKMYNECQTPLPLPKRGKIIPTSPDEIKNDQPDQAKPNEQQKPTEQSKPIEQQKPIEQSKQTEQPKQSTEEMTKNLETTFHQIQNVLKLNANINQIPFSDFSFTETTD